MPEPIDNLFNHERAIITHSDEEVCAKVNRILAINTKKRNEMANCPVCNGNIQDRLITYFAELMESLYTIYCWCGEHQCHEFEMKDIRHLLNNNTYARFGDLVRNAGIVYRPKEENEMGDKESRKALYGINMARAKDFFAGKEPMNMQLELNQITNEIIEKKPAYVGEFPKLISLIQKNGLYNYK